MREIDPNTSESTWWARIRENKIAFFRDTGLTRIIVRWPGEPPPREGRAPSYQEYVLENMAASQRPRAMPAGVHRGRPRKHPAAVE